MFDKAEWQRNHRRKFKSEHGYSERCNYGAGKLREEVLQRDGRKCVRCGMTDVEHLLEWNRPITIDHKNKDRSQNTLKNLQTLCLRCHGSKDISAKLIASPLAQYKDEILKLRRNGNTYQSIADELGFSIGAVWKWCQKWKEASA